MVSRSGSEAAGDARVVRTARPDRRLALVGGAVALALALQCLRAVAWVDGGGSVTGAVAGVLASVVVSVAALAYARLSTPRADHLAVVVLGATSVGAPWLTLRTAGVSGAALVSLVLAAATLACLGARRNDSARRPLLVGGVVVAIAGTGFALLSPSQWSVVLPPESAAQAAGEVVMGTALRMPAAWVCAALMALGAVRVLVLRRAGTRSGVVGLLTLLALGALYVGASSPGLPVLGADGFAAYPSSVAVAAVMVVPWLLVSCQGSLLLAEAIRRTRSPAVTIAAALALVVLVVLGPRGLVAAILRGAGL